MEKKTLKTEKKDLKSTARNSQQKVSQKLLQFALKHQN